MSALVSPRLSTRWIRNAFCENLKLRFELNFHEKHLLFVKTHLLCPYPSIHRVSFARCLMPVIARTCQSSTQISAQALPLHKAFMRERGALQIFQRLQQGPGRREPQMMRMRTLLLVKQHQRRRELCLQRSIAPNHLLEPKRRHQSRKSLRRL